METKYNCSPKCDFSDKIVFKNKFDEFVFCKNCSLLYRKNLKEYKEKVLSFEKFNKNFNEEINKEKYIKQISEHTSIIKKIIKITKKNPHNILDYGCGYGVFMFACKKMGFYPHGYDINKNFTANLSTNFKTFKSEEELLEKNNSKKYDLIFCKKVLTMSSNIYKDFNNFNDLLSPNGYLVIMDQVKNSSKYKSMISLKNNNNTLLLTIEALNFYGNIFQLKSKYTLNDFGDILIIFEKGNYDYKNQKISLNKLKKIEKFSIIFMLIHKIQIVIKNLYYFLNKLIKK